MALSSKQMGELRLISFEHSYSDILAALATLANEDVNEQLEDIERIQDLQLTMYRRVRQDLLTAERLVRITEHWFDKPKEVKRGS